MPRDFTHLPPSPGANIQVLLLMLLKENYRLPWNSIHATLNLYAPKIAWPCCATEGTQTRKTTTKTLHLVSDSHAIFLIPVLQGCLKALRAHYLSSELPIALYTVHRKGRRVTDHIAKDCNSHSEFQRPLIPLSIKSFRVAQVLFKVLYCHAYNPHQGMTNLKTNIGVRVMSKMQLLRNAHECGPHRMYTCECQVNNSGSPLRAALLQSS